MKKINTVCVLALLLMVGNVFADDLNPPTLWQRGEEGSTYQKWEFSTDDTTPDPDDLNNPYGDPELSVYPMSFWEDDWGGRNGLWPLSGMIVVDIPNNPVENRGKLIQIQITWAGEVGNADSVPCLFLTAKTVTGETVPQDDIVLEDHTDVILEETDEYLAGEYWHHSTYLYRITPNPTTESLWIGSAIMLDGLVVDTICGNDLKVPEPTTLLLLGLGGIGTIVRKRRGVV